MARARATAQLTRLREVPVNAPVGGLNTIAPGLATPASDCVQCWNLIGGELGLRSRLGWREWCTGLDGEVRSLLPFSGSTSDGSTSKLFACTETGIWDVTASTDSPDYAEFAGAVDVVFGIQNADSGYTEYTAFTDLNGAHWLLATDEANGYYTYAESGAVWKKIAQGGGADQIDGVNPADFVQVIVHQHRCWFVERDSQTAWYTDTLNALYGTVKAFNFGSHFPHGGDLRCLATWSIDGGSGPEARLVAVSGGGDVVIYEGTDPTSADTWRIVSQWYVGGVPVGRRLISVVGGDVAIMSSVGIVPISKISLGNPVFDRSQYATAKISNLFIQLQQATSTLRGWAMRIHPQDACLMVLVPTVQGQECQQLVMSLITRGWHRYRHMPMGLCAEPWNGTLYFGTLDGRVCVNDGYLDGVTLADPNTYSAIQWFVLTPFSNLGSVHQKRVQHTETIILSDGGNVAANTEARYSFDLTEPSPPSTPIVVGTSLWDVGLWDVASWGDQYQQQRFHLGAWGCGPEVALATAGKANSRMTLVGWNVRLDEGAGL